MADLTDKQRVFIKAYLAEGEETFLNATKSAEKAGYKHPNMAGPRLMMVNDGIREAIRARLYAAGGDELATLGRWVRTANVDISPYVSADGLDIEGMKEDGLGWMITGIRKTQYGTTVDLRDPERADEDMAKALGMFWERRVVQGDEEKPVPVRMVGLDDFRKLLAGLSDDEVHFVAELARRFAGLRGSRGGA